MFLHLGDFFVYLKNISYLYMMDEEDIPIYENLSMGYLQEILESKYEFLISRDKRSKEYKSLKEEYNKIAKIYNVKAKFKIYTIIK